MSISIFRRLVIVFALGTLLGVPAISLARPYPAVRRSEERTAKVPASPGLWTILTRAWEKAGCMIDPNGPCRLNPSSLDAGCSADPYGRCLNGVQVTSDAGCSADPYGKCVPGH